jgi:Domain of unknown function (DUF397)/Helix-turn-helix domain
MTHAEDRAYGATVAKRRLSRRLAAMRGGAGLTANEVSDKLNWNRGRLQRIEANQWRLPEPSYVRDLVRIYGAADAEQAELLDLVVRARERLWWRSYEDVFGKDDTALQEVTNAVEVRAYKDTSPGYVRPPSARRRPGRPSSGSPTLSSDMATMEVAMSTADLVNTRWRKAARSGQANGGCVEIAGNLRHVTGIRDSLRPEDGPHVTSKAAFAAFLADAKAGHYDIDRLA